MIAAVVLAAGASKRLGRPKQLVELHGRTLVERTVLACAGAGCSPVIVTVGHAAEQVRQALEGVEVTIVDALDWPEGMSASVRAGISVLDPSTDAVVLAVCDQLGLSSAVIRRLVDEWDRSSSGRVACSYAGVLGVPALFGREWFRALGQLSGGRGAQVLFDVESAGVRSIEWAEGAHDLDGSDGAGVGTAL